MVNVDLPTFERTLVKTNAWLDELMVEMGTDDRREAYRALRATLHALRDRLGPHEAAHLGAQLPLLIRGVYYEGWHPAGKPLKDRPLPAFLSHIDDEIISGDSEHVARCVFALLDRYISQGEIEDVRGVLPAGVRDLWP
jgi:uncharacterized protein (DUF2267 family)